MADKYLSEQKLKKKLAYIFRVYNFTPSRRKDIYAAIEKSSNRRRCAGGAWILGDEARRYYSWNISCEKGVLF